MFTGGTGGKICWVVVGGSLDRETVRLLIPFVVVVGGGGCVGFSGLGMSPFFDGDGLQLLLSKTSSLPKTKVLVLLLSPGFSPVIILTRLVLVVVLPLLALPLPNPKPSNLPLLGLPFTKLLQAVVSNPKPNPKSPSPPIDGKVGNPGKQASLSMLSSSLEISPKNGLNAIFWVWLFRGGGLISWLFGVWLLVVFV